MTPREAKTHLFNFTLEKTIKSPQELRENGYDGFGAVIVIINEFGQILMVQETNNKVGDEKKSQWGPVYETGNQYDADSEMTMLAGLASELGFETLSKLRRYADRTYGYDFKRSLNEAPSRSLISVCHLASHDIPKPSNWGHELNFVKWMSTEEIFNLPDSQVRVNAKAILNELVSLNALKIDPTITTPISIPSTLTPQFLSSRDPKLDIHWCKVIKK